VSASLSRLSHPRVGFVVPKHGRSAVERNLLKRRLRELVRTLILHRLPVVDLVIHARPSAYRLDFAELTRLATIIEQEAARIATRLAAVDWFVRALLILLVRGYQVTLSPMLPPSCRYMPSCSAYAIEALEKHGAVRGSWLAARRILRCHPFRPGGYDPVP
jgi:putative membrane protein insertion efficiency factor/ribonuclease P protein component